MCWVFFALILWYAPICQPHITICTPLKMSHYFLPLGLLKCTTPSWNVLTLILCPLKWKAFSVKLSVLGMNLVCLLSHAAAHFLGNVIPSFAGILMRCLSWLESELKLWTCITFIHHMLLPSPFRLLRLRPKSPTVWIWDPGPWLDTEELDGAPEVQRNQLTVGRSYTSGNQPFERGAGPINFNSFCPFLGCSEV